MKLVRVHLFIAVVMLLPTVLLSQTLEEMLDQGDQLVKEFKNEKALEVYKKADVKYPDNWEVLWRISRALVDIGEHMPASTSEQEDAQLAKYQLAFDYADRAVQLAPDQSLPYLRRAIANGRIALFKGVFSVAGVVNSVRDDCEKAIELGTGGEENQGIAHYVLARTHAKISEKWAPARAILGLGWADIDSAIVHYKKAVDLYPNFRMIYLDYARALIEEDEYEDARTMLQNVMNSPVKDEDDDIRFEEAQILMEEIKDE